MEKSETENKINIAEHSENQFLDIVKRGLIEGGINLNAMKNWGKSRLLFAICQTLRTEKFDKPIRCICFDGSEAWLYGFSRIPTLNITENDITATEQKTALDMEQFQFNNWNLIKLALVENKDLLFRFKTKRPSKRGFAIRQIVNYLDDIQRNQRETEANHEPKQRIAYFLDELQDAFSNRSTMRLDCETFLCAFNESRNNYESFFSANIRETETAKQIRAKQLNAYGKIPDCDKTTYHRRLEKMYNVNLSNLQKRNWFFEGIIFKSPDFTQHQKPFLINRSIRAKYQQSSQTTEKYPSILKASAIAFFGLTNWYKARHKNLYSNQTQQQPQQEEKEFENEDSELDLTMTDGNDDMFPSDLNEP